MSENNIAFEHAWSTPPWHSLSHHALFQLGKIKARGCATTRQKAVFNQWIRNIAALAETNSHILLTTNSFDAEGLLFVAGALRALPGLKKYGVRPVLVLGRQDIVLEQRCRLARDPALTKETARHLTASSLAAPCTGARRLERGGVPAPVPLVDSGADYTGACGDAALVKRLFDALHCRPPDAIPPPGATYQRLLSREARHLLWLCNLNGNAWPYMQEALPVSLARIERELDLDRRPVTSPQERQNMLAACAAENDRLARTVLRAESLFPSADIEAKETDWEPYTGLAENILREMVRALPENSARRLARRFASDEGLLTQDQKRLAACLFRRFPTRPQTRAHREKPKVSVLTLTYNHEAYIGENIESVLAQQTDFPVEHIIVDDCSNDGTREIIAGYARRFSSIRPVFLFRRAEAGQNVQALFARVSAPYAALCDGDDYFADPRKLQKQADLLDAHPACALCFHPVRVVYEQQEQAERIYPPLDMLPRGIRPLYYLADLLKFNMIQTNSVMYRWRFSGGLPPWFVPWLIPGDWYWHLLHAETGHIGFINEVMSVYRRHEKSLYYLAEVSDCKQRRRHGIAELEMYDVVDRHFRHRYASSLKKLANGVFANFLQLYIDTGDDNLLQEASSLYPEFAAHFLHDLEIVRAGAAPT